MCQVQPQGSCVPERRDLDIGVRECGADGPRDLDSAPARRHGCRSCPPGRRPSIRRRRLGEAVAGDRHRLRSPRPSARGALRPAVASGASRPARSGGRRSPPPPPRSPAFRAAAIDAEPGETHQDERGIEVADRVRDRRGHLRVAGGPVVQRAVRLDVPEHRPGRASTAITAPTWVTIAARSSSAVISRSRRPNPARSG